MEIENTTKKERKNILEKEDCDFTSIKDTQMHGNEKMSEPETIDFD